MFLLRLTFIVIGVIIEILLYSFSNLFLGKLAQPSTGFLSLVIVTILAFFRLLFILLIPMYIGIEMAGNYITDIFELKVRALPGNSSGKYRWSASEVLHIRDGKIVEADQDFAHPPDRRAGTRSRLSLIRRFSLKNLTAHRTWLDRPI